MTAALATDTREPHNPWLTRAVGIALVVLSGLILLGQHRVRLIEAHVSAFVQALTGVDARSVGTAVIFPHGAQWIGLSLNAGCTSALLMIPFGVIAGGLLLGGRLTVRRGLATLAAVILLVFVVNQLRIGAVAASMRVWGLQAGYDRSHVLLGSLVSTFGVAVGVVIFLVSVSAPGRRSRAEVTRSDEGSESP
jgi:exosortase/archaeosortase family protein